ALNDSRRDERHHQFGAQEREYPARLRGIAGQRDIRCRLDVVRVAEPRLGHALELRSRFRARNVAALAEGGGEDRKCSVPRSTSMRRRSGHVGHQFSTTTTRSLPPGPTGISGTTWIRRGTLGITLPQARFTIGSNESSNSLPGTIFRSIDRSLC